MASTLQFKAHSYGANMESLSAEVEVVKMVVEMLLGLCNDLFTHFDEPIENLFSFGSSPHKGTFTISVFHVTHFGLHIQMQGLSSALVKGVLNWFAQFGTYIFVCRKFANTFVSGKEQHHLSSAVIDTFKSTLTSLLTTVEESLCAFESQVLRVQTADATWNHENNQLRHSPKLTLIGLYQQCLKLAPLFRSLSGVVGSVVTVMAATLDQSTNDMSTIFEKLLVRGVMQEISDVIKLGRLVDISPLQGGGKVSITSCTAPQPRAVTQADLPSKDLFGGKAADLYTEHPTHSAHVAGSPERTPELSSQPVAVDLSLKLHLPSHTQSPLYLFSKLFLTAMSEQYLTNLTTAVWHQQNNKPSSTVQAERSAQPSAQQSSSVTTLPSSAGGAVLRRDTSAAGSDSRIVNQAIATMGVVLYKQGSRSATRQAHRKHLALLRRIGPLVSSDGSYEVPNFLAAITAEATVSSSDIQILQKSHIQRQNQSYNLSRLKVLVHSSAEECRAAIIPEYHHSVSTGNTSTITVNQSSDYQADPVMSYLRTGRSVKIVGVRTPKVVPSYRVHRPDKSNEAALLEQAAAAEADRASAREERQKLTQSSLTLLSYEAGALSSNAHYLNELTGAGKTSAKTAPPPNRVDVQKGSDIACTDASVVVLSQLLCYTPSAVAVELGLLSSLREQLQQARVDCAAYVRKSHFLSDNLRFVRDVFFLGQPDLYAPIRELCLSLTDWRTYSEAAESKRGYTNKASDIAFMGESIASAIVEKMPKSGVRHVAVQVQAEAGLRAPVHRPVGSSPIAAAPTTSRGIVDLLRDAVSSMCPPTAGAAASDARIRGTDRSKGVLDEVTLLTVVSTLNVALLHQWPLTYFIDNAQLRSLNSSLRFLMLVTASRWAAEYWWMDVISNDSLNTAASGNPKADLRTGRSFTLGRTLSAQDLYLGDVLQAKRNTRAGLGIWLHCVSALNNIFMAHIHRTLWPSFEEALTSHEDSLLQMKGDLQEVLADATASLQLLRECILEVVVLGFAAAQALRDAIICEQAELSVVVEHNNGIRAARLKNAPRKPKEKAESVKGKDAPKPWKTQSNAPLARTSSAHSMVSDTDTVVSGVSGIQDEESSFASYHTSAAALIAFRASEDAFAALKAAVECLKKEVAGAVRSRLAMGRVDREGKALEELHMALS